LKNITIVFSLLFITATAFISCSKDEDPIAKVNLSAGLEDFDGDVNGNGGTFSKTYDWNNTLTTVDWNMDITAAIGGEFQLIIRDAEGSIVLDQTLRSGQNDDSGSGVSSSGTAGAWQITIVLSTFSGDGSFSISPGN
jgi:hypothetical protein